MAIIGIHTEPSGHTRVLFDFTAPPSDLDEVGRIAAAMARAREGVDSAPVVLAPPRGTPQAASARRTSRPVTLPSRKRIKAS
jgi:hypothetical protein